MRGLMCVQDLSVLLCGVCAFCGFRACLGCGVVHVLRCVDGMCLTYLYFLLIREVQVCVCFWRIEPLVRVCLSSQFLIGTSQTQNEGHLFTSSPLLLNPFCVLPFIYSFAF